ncbi:MAG: hypothetical protein GY711_29815, partial [bacterium]|nr:hypothetical protein [bacterium]
VARVQEQRILADLGSRFELLQVHEVHWSPDLVATNFQRFYSDLDVRGVYHIFNKGFRPFLAVTLVDPEPVREARMTSRGRRDVNARFVDAKLEYRSWLGSIGVHCGETPEETRRDTCMLVGDAAAVQAPWNGDVAVLRRDVRGAHGWSSWGELFDVLHETVRYVALGGGGRALELLTDDYHSLHTILNAHPCAGTAPDHGGAFRVSVGGVLTLVGIRLVGDGWLDTKWQEDLLESRVLAGDGAFRPSEHDAFPVLAYRVCVQTPRPSHADRERVEQSARRLGHVGWTADALMDPPRAKAMLDGLLRARGYTYARPRDPTVFCNHRFLQSPRPDLRRAADLARLGWHRAARQTVGLVRAQYLRVRDRALLAAPWVRGLKRALRRGT